MSQTKAQLLAPVGIFTASGINVSGTLTATSYSGDGGSLTGVGVGTTASVNTSGIVTAVSFSGDGSNLSGVGFGTADSAVTTGIVTASKFSGSGIGLTNVGGPIAGLVYSPTIGASDIALGTNIEIIFNKPIVASAGTITLRTGSADGTIIESFDVETSDRLTIDAARLTIDPTDSLSGFTTYFAVIPSGVFTDTLNASNNVGITTYSFTTINQTYELYGFGLNEYGKIGLNDEAPRSSPTQVPGTQWTGSMVFGYYTTGAVKSDATLWMWGRGTYGQLGQNTSTATANRSSPVQVPGTQWNKIGGSDEAFYGTKTDGTLWSWGRNPNGNLGLNATTPLSSPTQIPGTDWTFTTGGDYSGPYPVGGLKTDGTLWMWGYNGYGNTGHNDLVNYSSPVQIPGTQWNVIHPGYNTLATKDDGTLWTWGNASDGRLGLNSSTIHRSSPTQIPGTQWVNADSNQGRSLATKTDGTLWVWGRANVGILGLGDATVLISSPHQIPGTQWNLVSCSYYSSLATKTDNTLWAWGYGGYGQLGDNSNATVVSSPIQIPGTQWTKLNETGIRVYTNFAFKSS